ncbi:hypothetical protein sos41_13810 [Alphaproteobacteria bacterium SO-S41]|nr:hypothetical protein sos41_13810 [Alphaproteobacteria bacterium SO-S41]
MTTSARPYHHGDLRRRLLETAETVLEREGAAALSLRELARTLEVSHNAPYRHFPTRDALLAAIAEAGYRDLAERLASAGTGLPTREATMARGLAYIGFALERRAVFRLMFTADIESPAHPGLRDSAHDSLQTASGQIAAAFGDDALGDATLSAWAFVHGLAAILLDGQVPTALREGRSDLEVAKGVIGTMMHALSGHA